MFRTLSVSATVDAQYLTGDVTGFLRYQEGARGGDVFRLAHTAHRRLGNGLVDVAEESVLLRAAQHRRIDEAGRDGIDRDAAGPILEGQRLGEAVDRGLSRYVVRHVGGPGMRA